MSYPQLSGYHPGYRAFTRTVLEDVPFRSNSDDFIFDNQILSQAIFRGYRIGELSCPTKYLEEASSLTFRRSVVSGLGVVKTAVAFRLAWLGWDSGTVFQGLDRRHTCMTTKDAQET